jgi:hypothetical protein
MRDLRPLLQIRRAARLKERFMHPARFKLHAEERTCSPVQRPNFRGQGTKKEPQKTKTISPEVSKVHQGRQN